MARGAHPQRTPFYGVCLLSVAFLACWLGSSIHVTWLTIAVYVLAAVIAAVGFLMTFRDYSECPAQAVGGRTAHPRV